MKMSARTRSSAAAGRRPRSGPKPRRPAGAGVSSPRTATAVASSLVDGPSVASRCSTNRLTAAGPTACTSLAASAEGTIPAASSARSSSRRNSGLPPVARVARAAELLGGVVPQPLPGQGLGRRLAQRPRIQRHRRGREISCAHTEPDSSAADSGGRPASAITTGRPSIRCARYARKRSDSRSAHWQSSTSTASGSRSARLTTSQYRLCSASKPPSAPAGGPSSGSNRRAAGPAPPGERVAAVGRLVDHRLQHLAHDAERERLLEL